MTTTERDLPLLIGDVARELGVTTWQIRNAHRRGILAEPGRLGPQRYYWRSDLPAIRAALAKAGYVK